MTIGEVMSDDKGEIRVTIRGKLLVVHVAFVVTLCISPGNSRGWSDHV